MDENFLQSILNPTQPGLADQYSAGALQAPQAAALDPTAQAAPPTLEQQYSPQGLQAQPEQPLAPPPGMGADPSNILQAVAPQPDPQHPVVAAVNALQANAQPSASGTIPAPAPRARHSVLDMIGHLADAVATVGGSKPMYQPSLDAARARANELQDRAMAQIAAAAKAKSEGLTDNKTIADTAQTQLANSGVQAAKLARVVQQAAAAEKATPGTGLAKFDQLSPLLAGVPADQQKTVRDALANGTNPDDIVAGLSTNKDDPKYSLVPTAAKDKDGNDVFFQTNDQGETKLVDGFTPTEKLTYHDAGDHIVGTNQDGKPVTVFKKNASPDTIMSTEERAREADQTNARQTTKTDAKLKPVTLDADRATHQSYANLDLQLKNIQDNPNLGMAYGAGALLGHIPGTAGANVRADVKTALGQALSAAIAKTKEATGSTGSFRAQREAFAQAQALTGQIEDFNQSPDHIRSTIAQFRKQLADIDGVITSRMAAGKYPGNTPAPAAPVRAPVLPRTPAARTTAPTPHPADISGIMAKYGIR